MLRVVCPGGGNQPQIVSIADLGTKHQPNNLVLKFYRLKTFPNGRELHSTFDFSNGGVDRQTEGKEVWHPYSPTALKLGQPQP